MNKSTTSNKGGSNRATDKQLQSVNAAQLLELAVSASKSVQTENAAIKLRLDGQPDTRYKANRAQPLSQPDPVSEIREVVENVLRGVMHTDIDYPASADRTIVIKDVPYRASAWATVVTTEGPKPRAIEPNHVIALRDGRIYDALTSLTIEARIELMRVLSFKHVCDEALLSVSMLVPVGHFMVDTDSAGRISRIIVNEFEAEERACDADGDRACLIWNKELTKALFLKWPFTQAAPVLTYIPGQLVEIFDDITADHLGAYMEVYPAPNYTLADIKAAFLKCHSVAEVGLRTSQCNMMDAYRMIHHTHRGALSVLKDSLDTGYRYLYVEKQGMKAQRKHGVEMGQITVQDMVLNPHIAGFLTGKRSITKRGQQFENVSWMYDKSSTGRYELIYTAMRAWKLSLTPTDFEKPDEPFNFTKTLTYTCDDTMLLDRVIDSGYLKVEAYPHWCSDHNTVDGSNTGNWPKFPFDKNPLNMSTLPVISLYLVNERGNPISLTDTKRADYNVEEGALSTYLYMLPPVWDCDSNNGRGGFVHPLQHLAKYLQTWSHRNKLGERIVDSAFDSTIKNPVTGETVILFGSQKDSKGNTHRNLRDEDGNLIKDARGYVVREPVNHFKQYKIKATLFQQALAEYLGNYGYAVPASRQGARIVPGDLSTGNHLAPDSIRKQIVVDYGTDSSAEKMWTQWKRCNAVCQINCGSKKDDRRVRKYFLAHNNGTAIIGSKFDDLARPGKSMSQRVHAATPPTKFRVAVVVGDTLTQAHITPSGIAKQTASVFKPQPLNTEAEYLAYCTAHHIEPEATENQPISQVETLTGEIRQVWRVPARETAEIGKLCDYHGMKVVPRQIEQVTTINPNQGCEGELVDLIIPLHEFVAKRCHWTKFGNITQSNFVDIHIPGPDTDQIVHAIVIDMVMYRTGTASENIVGRTRPFKASNMDGQIALEGMYRLDPTYQRTKPNFSYVIELIEFGRRLIKQYNINTQ